MIASVCIGTHNAEKFIVETLNSVKDQTLKDIECIIVDDHSTDRTCEIIYNEFCSKDPRFKLFVNCTDLQRPYVDAMNLSYQYASGKYLVRLDHDDVLYPDNIEYQVDYLEKHPEIGATCMNNWMCNTDTNGNIIKDTELKDIPLIEYLKNNVKKSQSHEGIDEFNNFNTFSIGENPAVWNNVGSCIRKSVIETYNLKYEEFIQGDYVHNIKLSSLVRMFKHYKFGVYYRLSLSSLSNNDIFNEGMFNNYKHQICMYTYFAEGHRKNMGAIYPDGRSAEDYYNDALWWINHYTNLLNEPGKYFK